MTGFQTDQASESIVHRRKICNLWRCPDVESELNLWSEDEKGKQGCENITKVTCRERVPRLKTRDETDGVKSKD